MITAKNNKMKIELVLMNMASAALQDWNAEEGIGFTSYKRSIIPGEIVLHHITRDLNPILTNSDRPVGNVDSAYFV